MKKNIMFLLLLFCLCFTLLAEAFVERRFPYKPEDVLQANKFLSRRGYWEGYKDNKLAGYVFLSKDWTKHLVGYANKHLETLIGIDTKGVITGVKVVAHSEPIFMIGIKDSDYEKFVRQYVGKNISDSLTIGKEISMDAITGATVTAVVQNAIILGSSKGVAELVGMRIATKRSGMKISQQYAPLSWDELLSSGALRNIVVTNRDLGLTGGDEVYVDLYVGIVTPTAIGRNVLGERTYKDTMKRLKGSQSALVIFTKSGAFKGTGFAYGGVFGTISVVQNNREFIFTGEQYENVTDISAKGAPQVREGGVFFLTERDFDQTMPFRFNLILPYYSGAKKTYKTFSVECKVPDRFLNKL